MQFTILAVAARQQIVALNLEAASEALAADQARARGLTLVSMEQSGPRLPSLKRQKKFPATLFSILLASLLVSCGGGDGGDGTSGGGTSVTISEPPADGGDGGGASPIDPAHILTHASADMPFSQQSGYTAQVINTYTSASQIPESGIHGTTLPNGETLRFGKTADPSNSLRKALAFQVRNSDPLTSKGMRAEISAPQNIEMNEVYWIAFSAYIHDWGTLASTDSSLFGTQVHSGDNALGLSPSFSLYTRQNGRAFQVQARYSEAATPSQSNSTTVGYAEYPIPFHQWTDFVLKFKHNTSGNGFLQVWMNGQMIANYQGSLGFNTPGMKDYAKFGYYNWTASAMNSTPRNVLLRAPTLVADPTGQTYSAEQVRTLLSAAAVH